jgi:hypothetical protein
MGGESTEVSGKCIVELAKGTIVVLLHSAHGIFFNYLHSINEKPLLSEATDK